VVRDFARDTTALNTPLVPGLVNTQYLWVPYDVHQVYARLRYRW
jgi:hypothetical protein